MALGQPGHPGGGRGEGGKPLATGKDPHEEAQQRLLRTW